MYSQGKPQIPKSTNRQDLLETLTYLKTKQNRCPIIIS